MPSLKSRRLHFNFAQLVVTLRSPVVLHIVDSGPVVVPLLGLEVIPGEANVEMIRPRESIQVVVGTEPVVSFHNKANQATKATNRRAR